MNEELYQLYNPWWQKTGIPDIYRFPTKRETFSLLQNELKKKNRRAVSLIGLRRTGKTVLLYQLIEHLLKKQKVNPNHIFFLKTDDPSIRVEENVIADFINYIEKLHLTTPLANLKKPIYVFLDEIQKIEDWGEYIKKYYDLGWPIKFFISGSASIKIVKTTRENLAGRAKETILSPLFLRELFNWQGNNLQKLESQEIFKFGVFRKRASLLHKKCKPVSYNMGILLNQYLLKGGFPQLHTDLNLESTEYIKKEILERTIFRDIPEITKIKNPFYLQQILVLLAKETSSITVFREISRKLGIKYETLTKHIFYLENSFILMVLRKYSRGGISQAKAQQKIHLTSSGITTALNNLKNKIEPNELLGKVIEGVVVSTLKFSHQDLELFFYRDKKGKVDLVLSDGKRLLPIEITYQKALGKKSQNLERFKQKFKKSLHPLILTKNTFKLEDDKTILPVWLFLLLI